MVYSMQNVQNTNTFFLLGRPGGWPEMKQHLKTPTHGESNAHAWPRSGLEHGATVGGTWRPVQHRSCQIPFKQRH